MTHQFLVTVLATCRKELRLLRRDRLCLSILIVFFAGLAWACWSSQSLWQSFANDQAELRQEAREAWLSQTTANAHMATHVGQTVYKPISPLTGFDPGEVPAFGSRIHLQSHTQTSAANPPSRDTVAIVKDEAFSPAVLLGLAGPLLIIVLGNAAISREREGGTLSILMTTGSTWPAIVVGKGLAVLFALFLVSTPVSILLFVSCYQNGEALALSELLIREVLLVIVMTLYFIGWLGLTLLVASKSDSTIGGFSTLLVLWSIVSLVMPRVSSDVATVIAPLPTKAEIRREKEFAVYEANRSSVDLLKADRDLEARLLKEFGVDRIEDLPIDLAGAKMIELEASANRLYDGIEERVAEIKKQQSQIMSRFQLVSPYMAIRAISQSLSATDRAHHGDFLDEAEKHRRRFVKELNTAEMRREKPGETPEERRKFWSQVTEYRPTFVSAFNAVGRSFVTLMSICVWAFAMFVGSLFATPPINRTR